MRISMTTPPVPPTTRMPSEDNSSTSEKATGNGTAGEYGNRKTGCADGHHDLVPIRDTKVRGCAVCKRLAQSIYDDHDGAAIGDFRVVCREDGCDYGNHIDADGDGYTNHSAVVLAQAALQDHQETVTHVDGGRHKAVIEQHPVAVLK